MQWRDYKMPKISISELYDMKKRKEINRTKSFDHIIDLCHRRIRNIASYGGMNCFYEIPGVMIGFPLYNLVECTEYLIEKLRGSGFLVQLLPPPHVSVVYISWDPEEINPKRKTKKPEMLQGTTPQRLIEVDNGNNRTRGIVHETKMIRADNRLKITNPLKDRFRIF